jgi:hypothetical protein
MRADQAVASDRCGGGSIRQLNLPPAADYNDIEISSQCLVHVISATWSLRV